MERKDKELKQASARVIQYRQEREQAWVIATTAQEKVELLEAELLKTQSEAATLRNACKRSFEDRSAQSATLANKDREIERLLDQVANLQRAVHESENSVEQRL